MNHDAVMFSWQAHIEVLQCQKAEKLVSRYVKFREDTLEVEDESGHVQPRSKKINFIEKNKLGVALVSKTLTKLRKLAPSEEEGNAMTKQNEKMQGKIKSETQKHKTQSTSALALRAPKLTDVADSARNAMNEFMQTNDARRSSSATKIQSRERGRQQRKISLRRLAKKSVEGNRENTIVSQRRLANQNSTNSRRTPKQPRIAGPRTSVVSSEKYV